MVSGMRNGTILPTRTYPAGATDVVPVTVTLAAETGFTITATLDGLPLPMGATVVAMTGYHEIYETKVHTTTNVLTTALAYQFIIAGPGRGTTEMGLPISQPWPLVNDAPSAFTGQVLDVIAPARYPRNLPVPVAVRLKKGASAGTASGDPLFCNGRVRADGYPDRVIQVRRGWGSTILPPRTAAEAAGFHGKLHALEDVAPIEFEAVTIWTDKSGNLSSSESWPPQSRVFLSGTLTIKPGTVLTVGAGTVIRAAAGAEIWVEPGGSVSMNGTTQEPIVFVPDHTRQPWGGIWLHQSATAAVAQFTATGTLFCCWGANQSWFTTAATPSRTIYSRHRQQQPCFAIGTGAVCRLTDCSLIGPITPGDPRGAGFAMKDGSLYLTRTSLQRCITGGEQTGGTVEIHSSALLEMTEPGTSADDGTAFDDQDNDGIYLVPGAGRTYHLSKTVIGWTKDDGIDSGGGGAGSTLCEGCWFESCTHEAFSNSGTGRIPESHNGVHFNNGQGMECGYGDNISGPLSLVDHCLIVGNLCGVRYGDNYNTFGTYDGTLTVRHSYLLHNTFRDAFAMEWRATSNWAYQDARIVAQNTKFSRAEDLAHQQGTEDSPANALWNPALDGAEIEGFMPVPGSNVGVALLQSRFREPILLYPSDGVFQARLSTFSSKAVSVPWQATGKADRHLPAESVFAAGTLTFQPGETVKSLAAVLPAARHFDIVRIALATPINAELTGPDIWYVAAPALETQQILTARNGGWSYFADRTAPASGQKPPPDGMGHAWTALNYNESVPWKTGQTAPLGWGNLGAGAPFLVLGTTLPTSEQGITTYFRKTFTVTDPAKIRSLSLDLLNDDGAVAFINGVPFPPVNVDPGTAAGGVAGIGSDKLATSNKGDGAPEITSNTLAADSSILSALIAGINVLAVEIHQSSATSADAVCDAALTSTLRPPGGAALDSVEINNTSFLLWDDSYQLLEESVDLQIWKRLPEPSNPFPVGQGRDRVFYRARQ